MIGTPGKWIQRKDDGGLIKLPKGHIWIEWDNKVKSVSNKKDKSSEGNWKF